MNMAKGQYPNTTLPFRDAAKTAKTGARSPGTRWATKYIFCLIILPTSRIREVNYLQSGFCSKRDMKPVCKVVLIKSG